MLTMAVYCTFLDATKAFDRVDYVKLFKLLVDRLLPSVSVRLLLNMYTRHVCRVSWNGVCSVPFSVLNGVKQGGVIRPVLLVFIWINFLINWVEAGVGCYIGNIFVGALSYADDIVLLALTARAMRLMLGICDHYALEYSILLNGKKLNVFHLTHVMAIHLLRKIYQSSL